MVLGKVRGGLVIALLGLTVAACTEERIAVEPADDPLPENGERKSVEEIGESRFSYLEQLPLSKQEAFIRFKDERDYRELFDFSPEDMIAVYLHCIALGDPDLLYEIVYDGGALPDRDTFRKEYYTYAANYDAETAVHYRYYDTIATDASTANEHEATVLVTARVGIIADTLALGLRQEDRIWKPDIYHLIVSYKDKAKAGDSE